MNLGLEKFRVRRYKVIKLLIFFMFSSFLWKTKDVRLTSVLFALYQSIADKLTINTFARGLSRLFEWMLIAENLFGLNFRYKV